MTTMLEEIKQRDAEFPADDEQHLRIKSFHFPHLGAQAFRDRRWLLARVEELSAALGFAIERLSGHEEPGENDDLRAVLASLTTPVVSSAEESNKLRAENRQLRAVLKEIADKLPCDEPCRPGWCAGCKARAALSPAPVAPTPRVNERQQLEIVAKLVERWVLGDLSTEDYHAAVKEIFGVSRAGQE